MGVPVTTIRRWAAPPLALLLAVASCDTGPAPADETPRAAAERPAAPAPVRDTVLEGAFRDAAAEVEGLVGVAAWHLERDVRASLDGDRRFAMASVYKLPIAYAAVQAGEVGPADSVAVDPADLAPGESPFAAGAPVPFARLVERSLGYSDNTASDVLLRVAGGPDEVTRRVRAAGVRDVRVDRSMRRIFAEWRGIMELEGYEGWSPVEFTARSAEVPPRVREEAQVAFMEDVRDTGTAEGIAALLAAVHRGEGLAPEGRRLLLEALEGTRTGDRRIRAGVPPGTTVAHKTGTLGPLAHDAGIVTLPGGRGHVALAVFVQSDAPIAVREGVIAAMARAVWDRFAEPADAQPGPGG
jgi:beta-lactamase class A